MIDVDLLVKFRDEGLDLNHHLVLYAKAYKTKHLTRYKVPEEVYTTLIEKGFLTKTRLITRAGSDFLEMEERSNKSYFEKFLTFWETFPSTNKVAHFPGNKSLRGNQTFCFAAYIKAIKRGLTHKKLLTALEAYIEDRTVQTRMKNKNQFDFIPHSAKWLTNEEYLPFLDAKEKEEDTTNYNIS